LKAKDIDLDRILVRRPEEGLLELGGTRVVIGLAAAAYRLAEDLEATLGREPARGVLTRFGYQNGFQEAALLRTYFDWESDLEWLLAGPRTRAIMGVGRCDVEELVVDRAKGLFRLTLAVQRSFEAEERKRRQGPTAEPTCDRLTGYLSGFASAFLGDEVLFVEHACAAAHEGATACRFEGRLSSEWGEDAERHRARYREDAIGERLASRDREVLEQSIKIEEQRLALAAKVKVEEANRLKSEFLANISHELRTPLNAILGYADLLLAKLGPKLPDVPRQNIERILANAEQLLRLINNILDISKVEAGRMVVHLESTDVREVLDRCVEDARVLVKDKPVELVPAYAASPLPRVFADAVKLQQCFTNVIANACKFTQRGSIRIDARAISGQRSGRAQGFLAIAVTDTGEGIAPEHHAIIFEPFRQVDASATREHGGTGLGLPIVRQLLGLMGGEIQVSSALGAGATFTLVVPTASQGDTPRAAQPRSVTASLDSEVLVIDDDPDWGPIVRAAVGSAEGRLARMRVRVEREPTVAIAAARVRPPAIILLDLRLPAIDGVEVLRLLREDERTLAVPIIVVSGRDDALATLALGATAALVKPVRPDQLVAAIESALGVRP
jgi:signal transduction histidine kinase/CheY-like chemotaxis protein